MRKLGCVSAVGAILLSSLTMVTLPVLANEQSAQDELTEVIVTAQKKSERLQDVPVPVTVLAADALAEQNQIRLQDYYASIPGLSLNPVGPGMQNLALRGVTVSVVGNPTVGVMIDDMPYGSSTLLGFGAVVLPDLDPGDLARVEVLRGPQGTLYGASSLGGLIKFVTREPSTERFSGRVQALGSWVKNGGGESGYGLRGAINVPVSGTFAVGLSGFTRRDPGFLDNATTGDDAVNSSDVYGGRVSALWQPTEAVSFKVAALLQKTDGDGTPTVDGDENLKPLYGDLAQTRQLKEGYSSKVRYFTGALKVRMGGVELASLSAYGMNNFRSNGDESPAYGVISQLFYGVDGANGGNDHDVTKFSQELRLSSASGDRYEWLLGAFYTHESAKIYQFDAATDLTTGEQVGILADYYFPTKLSERALFADLTVHFTEQFSVQFGGRGSHNIQHYREIDTGPAIPIFFGGTPSPVIADPQRTTGTAYTYLLTPEWKLSPDTMLYARFTSGYRLGGNNIEATIGQIPPNYEPDKTANYEAGIKGNLLDGRLVYDAAVYYTNWRNIQIYQYSPITFSGYNSNAGKAKTQGVELSFQARPAKGLTIAGMATLIDAKLKEDFPATAIFRAESGDRLPYSPRFSGSLSIDQDVPLGTSWTGFIGGAIKYQGARPGEFGSAFGSGSRFRFPSYSAVDVRAGVRSESWTVNLFVNNLTDKRGLIGARGNPYQFHNDLYYIQPRTLGLMVTKTF